MLGNKHTSAIRQSTVIPQHRAEGKLSHYPDSTAAHLPICLQKKRDLPIVLSGKGKHPLAPPWIFNTQSYLSAVAGRFQRHDNKHFLMRDFFTN